MRLVVLVDGEHHPRAVVHTLEAIASRGDEVLGAVFCGGTEKVDLTRLDEVYGVAVEQPGDAGVAGALASALDRWKPDVALDLTDEPVLSPADRFRLAAIALAKGVTYRGADFELRARHFERIVTKPSLRVYATGKRTGKTAVASAIARHAVERGHRPIIVAVGRGGPHPPRVIEAGTLLDPTLLLEWADAGQHASSDYVEDALTSGVTTIGCLRVGGGLAGATVHSNVDEAARIAQERDEDLVIFEGSGASFPDIAADGGVVCIPATITADELNGYLGPYRLLLADLAVVTMADSSSAAATEELIHTIAPELDVIHVSFRPEPLTPVRGRRAFLCSTAPASAADVLREHLESVHGCEIVGITHRLSDRVRLQAEIEQAPDHDIVLTELKAGAIDVAARAALAAGKEVVFVNNALVGDGIAGAFDRVLEKVTSR